VDRMLGPRTLKEEADEVLEAAGLPRAEPGRATGAGTAPRGASS
jgi:hypothetical protein